MSAQLDDRPGISGAPSGEATPQAAGRMPVWRGLVRTARPWQWTKNLLVFGAPASAAALSHGETMARAALAFASFCLVSSGLYFVNDAADVERDRAHERKRRRPMAAGVFPARTGWAVGAVLIAAGIAVAALTSRWQLVVVVAIYAANVIAYSLGLKHLAIVDIMSVAAGFLLRAIAGGAATGLPLSDWFLVVASFGSLYLVVGKRFAEHRAYAALPDGSHQTRPVMRRYSHEFLVYLRSLSSGALLVAYCLFAFQKAQEVSGSFPWYQLSIIPVVGGVLRYGLLIEEGRGEEPDQLLFKDLGLLVAAAGWLVLFALGAYFGS